MATETFVLDASAVVKTIARDEPHAGAFRDWMREARRRGASLLAPCLLRYELGQVMTRGVVDGEPSPTTRARLLEAALLGIRSIDGEAPEQWSPPLTYYDAAYLAVARAAAATLISYDRLLLDAADAAGVETISPS